MGEYDIVKHLETSCTYYLYNNEFETMPSLLGDNVVDLIYNAVDYGMLFFCARYINSSGQEVCENYRIIPDNRGRPPRLVRIK